MPISPPVKISVPFATSGLKNTIPANTNNVTGNAGYDAGFGAINMTPKTAGGIPPFGQDFNGIFFDVTTAIQFMESGALFVYDSAWATAVGGYPLGALVQRTDGTGLWRNVTANNTTNPETGGAGWQPEDAGSVSVAMSNANVTLTSLQASKSIIFITGTLTANLNLVLPTYVRQWLVVNRATGAFAVTVKTSAGNGVAVNTGSTQQVYGDGTSIFAGSTGASPLSSVNARISIPTASATMAFAADEVVVKAGVGGQSWVLSNISKNLLSGATGVGGMDTGTAPANGFVAGYVIYNPDAPLSATNPAMLGFNATSVTATEIYSGANMPAGYTASALVTVWRTTAGAAFDVGNQLGRSICIANKTAVSTSTPAASPTPSVMSTIVPLNAKSIAGWYSITNSTAGANISGAISSTSAGLGSKNLSANPVANVNGGVQAPFASLMLPVPQTLYYAATTSGGTMTFIVSVSDYTF